MNLQKCTYLSEACGTYTNNDYTIYRFQKQGRQKIHDNFYKYYHLQNMRVSLSTHMLQSFKKSSAIWCVRAGSKFQASRANSSQASLIRLVMSHYFSRVMKLSNYFSENQNYPADIFPGRKAVLSHVWWIQRAHALILSIFYPTKLQADIVSLHVLNSKFVIDPYF